MVTTGLCKLKEEVKNIKFLMHDAHRTTIGEDQIQSVTLVTQLTPKRRKKNEMLHIKFFFFLHYKFVASCWFVIYPQKYKNTFRGISWFFKGRFKANFGLKPVSHKWLLNKWCNAMSDQTKIITPRRIIPVT